MTDEDLKPMNAELQALLSEAKLAERAPDASTGEAIWARVAATVVGGGGGPMGGASGEANPAPGAAGSAAAGAAAVKGAAAITVTRAAIGIALYAAGIVSGVVVHRVVSPAVQSPSTSQSQSSSRVAPTPIPILLQPVHEPAVAPAQRPEPARTAQLPTAQPQPVAETIRDSAQERLLIERSRSALARGDATEAIAALQRHAVVYRNGQLAEERDALLVQALVSATRYDDARVRARLFRTSFPRSLFAGVVEAALRRIPAEARTSD